MQTLLAHDGAILRPSALPALDFSLAPNAQSLLAMLPGSDLLRRTTDFFTGYPAKSLLTADVSRSLLYLLARQVRPRVALEIGTFFAGTAEVLARALLANDHGQLITVDPFGGERVPPILASWPEELRSRVIYLDGNSMQCFMLAERENILFDLAFVDGNHSYEYAFYDLMMVARQASPGALVVMDNCEQPGVFWAAKRFLAENPAWRELGDALAAHSDAAPFHGLRSSFPASGFLILQAPQDVCLSEAPRSFESEPMVQPGLQGVELELDPAHAGGALHLLTFFRSFYHDLAAGRGHQQQFVEVVRVSPGQSELRVAFAAPLIAAHDPQRSYRRVEFILAWVPDVPGAPLRLRRPPAAIVLD